MGRKVEKKNLYEDGRAEKEAGTSISNSEFVRVSLTLYGQILWILGTTKS